MKLKELVSTFYKTQDPEKGYDFNQLPIGVNVDFMDEESSLIEWIAKQTKVMTVEVYYHRKQGIMFWRRIYG